MIPELDKIFKCNPVNSNCIADRTAGGANPTNFSSLGVLLSGLLSVVFYIAAFLAFFWLIWGAFQYILAQGKKEDLAKARNRIQWALIGLVVVFLSFVLARFASSILPLNEGVALPF